MHDRDRSYQNRDGKGAESYQSRDGEEAESYQSRDRVGADEWRLLSITDRSPVAGDGWRLARAILKRQAGSRMVMAIVYRPLADARGSDKTAC